MERLKHGKKVVGLNQTLKCVDRNEAEVIFVAADCDFRISGVIDELRSLGNIEIIEVESMKALGKACGIDVNAAIACIVK